MPFVKSASKSATEENFHDFKHGKTYRKTKKKHGSTAARKQMIAAVLSNKRKAEAKGEHKKHKHTHKKRIAGKR
jgi:hypothetical protein